MALEGCRREEEHLSKKWLVRRLVYDMNGNWSTSELILGVDVNGHPEREINI